MCGIIGAIFHSTLNKDKLDIVNKKVKSIFESARDRGRDSYGIVIHDGEISTYFDTDPNNFNPSFNVKTNWFIGNLRAEPTTEWIKDRDLIASAQPFSDKSEQIWVTHNGVIANDKDLIIEEKLNPKTSIDSEVIPHLLIKKWDGSLDSLTEILKDYISGSYALGIGNDKYPHRLFLACNYKPLYLQYDPDLDITFFASLRDNLISNDLSDFYKDGHIMQLPAYGVYELSKERRIQKRSLYDEVDNKSALVICSGGLDSTVATKIAIDAGYDVTILHFTYGCIAEKREIEAVKKISKYFSVPYRIVPLDWFRSFSHSSPLLSSEDKQVNHEGKGKNGAEFAYEWVPARNFIMYAVATGIAEADDFDAIFSGINLEESGAYPDNEQIFSKKLSEIMPYALAPNNQVKIISPLVNLMKHEIVKLGIENDTPFELTWSCYHDNKTHCGNCGPCYMRKTAFEMNDSKDPVFIDNTVTIDK